jgi:hypothetical protein
MKYETPKLTALTPAINAIQSDQSVSPKIAGANELDGVPYPLQEHFAAYVDWED